MNKKFSTLVASLLLATTVGTGYAQAQRGTISAAPSGEYVAAIENGKFYQLSNGRQVLIMDRTSKGTYVLKFVDYNLVGNQGSKEQQRKRHRFSVCEPDNWPSYFFRSEFRK